MVLQVIFWILLILCAIGAFVPDATSPHVPKSRWILVLILIAILGYKAMPPT